MFKLLPSQGEMPNTEHRTPNISMYTLVFTTSCFWLYLAIGCGVCFAGAILGWMAHVRSGRRRSVMALELLRFLAVSLLAVTLLGPELVVKESEVEKPRLVVLSDESVSMDSRDVADPMGGEDARLTRRDWIRQWRGGFKDEWSTLGTHYAVAFEGFAAKIDPDAARQDDLKATDMALALGGVKSRHPKLRAVLLASDGQWNKGGPPARRLDPLVASSIPVYCVGVGDERRLPDLRIERFTAPSTALMGDYVTVQILVVNHMRKEERGVLTLKDASGKTLRSAEFNLPEDAEEWFTLVWEPEKDGEYDMSVELPCPAGDSDPTNNVKTFRVTVKKDIIKALIVEADPRWEYRFLRNALIRDQGVEVDCLLLRPGIGPAKGLRYIDKFPDIKELTSYDVVFVGDVAVDDAFFTEKDARNLRELVERHASGVVFIPGSSGRLFDLLQGNKDLASLLPVSLNPEERLGVGAPEPERLRLTFAGRNHLLTKLVSDKGRNEEIWQNLPGFYWRAGALTAKGDAESLAACESSKNKFGLVPVLVLRGAGEGLSLFMGIDSAWRWRRGVEDLYHYRFWGQVIRSMARKRHLARSEAGNLVYSPETPEALSEVNVQAALTDPHGFPLRTANVSLSVTGPSGSTVSTPMVELSGGWGVYTGAFVPEKPGEHQITAGPNDDVARSVTAIVKVGDASSEKIGAQLNSPSLKELARLTGGRFSAIEGASALMKEIAALPKLTPELRRYRIWSEWWWLASIAGFFTLYWLGRKLVGLP